MTSKVVWDFSIYWGVNVLIFFHNKSQDLAFWTEMRHALSRFDKLNVRMQQFFRDRDLLLQEPGQQHGAGLTDWSPTFVNYMKIPYLHELHVELTAGLDDAALKTRVIENINLLEIVADEIFQRAPPFHPPRRSIALARRSKSRAGYEWRPTHKWAWVYERSCPACHPIRGHPPLVPRY